MKEATRIGLMPPNECLYYELKVLLDTGVLSESSISVHNET